MKDQLLDTWRIHHQMNILLIENTTDTGLQKTLSTRGGRTVYQQWVHVHNVRMQWLEICAKDIFRKYKSLDKEAPFSKKMLQKALDDSAKGIEELLSKSAADGGKVIGFKKGVIALLGYFISHESHHRGSILLTLKQTGEKIPDAVKWGLWEWNK
ncbi:MAG: DinB family protein [Chitinophagaceae bacterium]